jgi:LCP family protein required for cell wall assembly
MPAPMPQYSKGGTKRKKGVAEYVMYGFVALLVIIAGVAAYTHFAPSFKTVPNRVADGYQKDRINILLIGVGGDTHPGEGKDLADAIMVASLRPSTRQVALVSVPRDFYVNIGTLGQHRLNAAHALGYRVGYKGEGPGLLMDTVSDIIGQPMHAYVRIDFAAFEKVIDALGGVDIYVYRPFYDFLFKDGFEQGWQHLNGKRALRYARYRYVRASAEGNNFARELRQQQVITAIKDRIRNLPPQEALKLVNVARTVGNHTDTNLTTPQMLDLYAMFKNTERKDIRHVSLKKYTEVIMVRKPGDTGEAIVPFGGDYGKIHTLMAKVFEEKAPVVMRDEIQLTDVGAPPSATPAKPTHQQNHAAAIAAEKK